MLSIVGLNNLLTDVLTAVLTDKKVHCLTPVFTYRLTLPTDLNETPDRCQNFSR
ncbi:hypothetical protein [Egbenema bharatensis]|uniref:hypothetical protein n=1 Tax=Egbenema bharatensis TaxID=3463334 RepID=UPI003A849CCA